MLAGRTNDIKSRQQETRKANSKAVGSDAKTKNLYCKWKQVKERHPYREMNTAGGARRIEEAHYSDEENGLEAWRALHERFGPSTLRTEAAMTTKVFEVAKKETREVKEVPSAIIESEDKVSHLCR